MSGAATGAKEFRNSMREQKLPYSILAAKLPIEELVTALHNQFRIEKWQQNIDLQGRLSDLAGVPIIKFKDSPWTIAYWSIGRYLNIYPECWAIARKCDCGLIAMYETDRSGWIEWKAYKGEDEAESAERMHGDDTVYFKSHLRKEPQDLDDIEDKNFLRSRLDDLIDELLIKEQLTIPALELDLTDPNIERVDLLIFPTLPLGMSDFQKYIYQGQPEYSIFTIKADIDQVVPLLTKYTKTSEWKKDIQSEDKIEGIIRSEALYFMPIVQPTDNRWTVVYWSMWDWTSVSGMCVQISKDLETLVISLGEEDTSSAFGYELFDCGVSMERMESCGEMFFESKLREEPEFDDFDKDESETASQFMNDRFIAEGVYVPSWELSVSDPWIGRVDLLPKR